MNDDMFDKDDPEADFKIDPEFEDVIKTMVYELAVRNFIVTFSPECMAAKSEEECQIIKDMLLEKIYKENDNVDFHKEIPKDIYTIEKAYQVFDSRIKRGPDGCYEGKNKEFMDVTTEITIEIYEQTCLRMVDKGVMELVFDDKVNDFIFRPITKKEKGINKVKKPRKRKEK